MAIERGRRVYMRHIMIRILALSALLALNFANGASARPTPARRQLSFLPLEGLSSLNPTDPNPSANSNPTTSTNAGPNRNPSTNSLSNANPGDFNTVENSDNGVPNADANPAAFLSKITGAATGGLNSSFNNKRTAAKIPGFTGPSIEADVPSNLLPSVPTRRSFQASVQNVEEHGRRFIRNADFAEKPAGQGSDMIAAVNANSAGAGAEKRFIRNADYQEAGAPPSAANAVVAAASAAEGTSA